MSVDPYLQNPHNPPPDNDDPAAGCFQDGEFENLEQLLLTAPLNDLGNAGIFYHACRFYLIYTPGLGWMHFNGAYWKNGDAMAMPQAGNIVHLRHELFRRRAAAGNVYAMDNCLRLESLGNVNRLRGMVEIAKGMMAAKDLAFDTNPYLLNVANGVVDLDSGFLLPHAANHYLTRFTKVAYDPGAYSPLWEQTVSGIADDDPELVHFFQLLGGYVCSGDVSAQKFFYFYGQGANGKSLLTDLWAEVLGGFGDAGYAVRLPCETVLSRKERDAGGVSPDLLALRGKRLALFTEQSGDRPINPERLKDLSGGDSLTARAPYMLPITFSPTHTLIGCGNHLPIIHGSDYGIWRRMHIVPFRRRFKPSRLGEELRTPENLSAILAWMVRGAIILRQEGWRIPAVVEKTSREYQSEADLVREWISEQCEEFDMEIWSKPLFDAFDVWCKERQEIRISHSLFTRRLEQLGYSRRKSNGKPLIGGLRLRSIGLQG